MALDFFAGCVGGCAGVLVGHPLDTVKVKIQTQDFKNPMYRGTWHCFTQIAKTESIKGLYRGVTSPMGGVALVNAIIFGVYGNVQRHLTQHPGELTPHFAAGACAGFAQSFICSPMELAKTRLQVQKGDKYKGAIDCLAQTAKTEGFRGIFKGLGVTVLREVPAFGTYFTVYEVLAGGSGNTAVMLMAGGLAGTASWIISYPQDVIKTRLQSDGVNGPKKYNGTMDCIRKSLQAEGVSVLFRGLNSTIIRAFPTNAVTFTTVTWVFRMAGHSEAPEISELDNNRHSDKPQITIKLQKKLQNALLYYEERREAMHEMDLC